MNMMGLQLLIESEYEKGKRGVFVRVNICQLREIAEIDVFVRAVSGSDDGDADLYNFSSSYW